MTWRVRLLWGALGSLALLAALWRPAWAQGVGIFSRATCESLTAPVTNQTICWDQTAKTWRVWNGTTFASVTAVNAQAYGFLPSASGDVNRAAMDALMATLSGSNARVYIPAGTYTFGTATGTNNLSLILVRQGTGVQFVGDGIGRTILLADYPTVGNVSFISSTTSSDCTSCTDRISVRDLSLVMTGTRPANTGSPAIRVTNASQTITNVEIVNWHANGVIVNGDVSTPGGTASAIVTGLRCLGVTEYCGRVINSGGTFFLAPFATDTGTSAAFTFQGLMTSGGVIGGLSSRGTPGVSLEKSSLGNPSGIKVVDHEVRGGNFCVYTSGDPTVPYFDLTIQGNRCFNQQSAATAAIHLFGASRSIINANTIIAPVASAIALNGVDAVGFGVLNTISNNVIVSPGGSGISLTSTASNTLSNNTVVNGAAWGIVKASSQGAEQIGVNYLLNNASGPASGTGGTTVGLVSDGQGYGTLNIASATFLNGVPMLTSAPAIVIGSGMLDRGAGTLNLASSVSVNNQPLIVASAASPNLTNLRGISASHSLSNNLRGTCNFQAAATCVVNFAANEPDAHYFIAGLACSAANAAAVHPVSWSGKTRAGFTLQASVSNSNVCDWSLVR